MNWSRVPYELACKFLLLYTQPYVYLYLFCTQVVLCHEH
jgi:hypothetical protein